MAVITFNRASRMFTDYVLGASGTIVPPSSWTVALSTTLVSTTAKDAVWSATVSGTNVNEIGSTTAAGYARQTINRDQTGAGWGASTNDSTGSSSTGAQVTFGAFTGSGPSPNGAKSWVITDGSTLNAGQLYFLGETAATRTFAAGDTEKVTPTVKGT